MEIKIGIQHVNRELVVDSAQGSADVEQAFTDAISSDGVFTVTDVHGRRVMIPAVKIAYLDLGEENARRVGFGTV